MTLSVPVIIDSIKQDETFPFTRCFYYCIDWSYIDHNIDSEYDIYREKSLLQAASYFLLRPSHMTDLLLFSLSAIITGPSYENNRFDKAEDFKKLVDILDNDDPDFYLNQNAIWLPNLVLNLEKCVRGSVYRLGRRAFRLAHNFTEGQLDQEEYLANFDALREEVNISESETEAFKQWNEQVLEEIKEKYKSNRQDMLQKNIIDLSPRM
jgi:hypothetical protein